MTTVMIVEDDAAFLNRFCRIVAADPELELFAAVSDGASEIGRASCRERVCT